ncbi:hypothetical protein ACHAQA_000903 [Verticillium albo-atrum]
MKEVRDRLYISDQEIDEGIEHRAAEHAENRLEVDARITGNAQAAAHGDHADRGHNMMFPPITGDTLKWRDAKVAAAPARAPQDDSDSDDEFKYDKMYGFRSGAVYSSPMPEPLRIPSRDHQHAVSEKIHRAPAIQAAARPTWHSNPPAGTSDSRRVAHTLAGKTIPQAGPVKDGVIGEGSMQGKPRAIHPNLGNGKMTWKFPCNYSGSGGHSSVHPPPRSAQSTAKASDPREEDKTQKAVKPTDPSNRKNWDSLTIKEKLQSLDAFFDDDELIGYNLPPIVKEQQARYDASFAEALAMPSEHAESPRAKADRDAVRADNKAAGDRISSAYHESMRRILGSGYKAPSPLPTTDGVLAAASESPGIFKADQPPPAPTVTLEEIRREKLKAALRKSNEAKGSEDRRQQRDIPPCPTREAPVVPGGERRFRRALTEPPKPTEAYGWDRPQG